MTPKEQVNLSALIKILCDKNLNHEEAMFLREIFSEALHVNLRNLIETYGKEELHSFVKGLPIHIEDQRFLFEMIRLYRFLN